MTVPDFTTMRSAQKWCYFGGFLLAATELTSIAALDNGLGIRRPAMGWSSWNHFRCEISDSLIRETADAIVSSGLRDAGYVYV